MTMREKLRQIAVEADLFTELSEEEKAENKRIARDYPCETCRHGPPSSFGGKPCCVCDTSNPLTNCYDPREAENE